MNNDTDEQPRPESCGKDAAYQREYYIKNADRVNERKRQLYQNNPEYRENARRRRKEQLEREKRARKRRKRKPLAMQDGTRRTLQFPNGGEYTTECYSISQMAFRVGVAVQTIRKWEREGVIPKPIYYTEGGHRIYTRDQMSVVKSVHDAFRARKGKWVITKEFIDEIHRRLDLLHFGVAVCEEDL